MAWQGAIIRTNINKAGLEDKKADAQNKRVSALLMRIALLALVFIWPLLFLFRQVFVINGVYTGIDNDFLIYYYKYKVYLLDCLANFHFPLWSPSESAGFPFYTSPFTQTFYPLNALLVLFYKVFGGYSPFDHQIFTVLGISIYSLGLYMWLKLINKDIKAVVFAVLIMAVSFKVTEITRFPNAVHAMAWHPWMMYAITRIMFSSSVKETVKSAGLLALFGIFLWTASYPYYAFYSVFLVLPYLFAFCVKPLRKRLFADHPIAFKHAAFAIPAAGFVTLLICAPYLVGVKRLMAQTMARAGKDFQYSTQHVFDFEDTVGSLVYPPASSAEGWYFFSITAVLIIAIYLFSRRNSKAGEEPQQTLPVDTSSLWIKLYFVLWFGLITYISYGRNSYIFVLLWKYMPGFSSLRAWGRMNIILVPILAWLLSIAYSHFLRVISSESQPPGRKHLIVTKLLTVTAVYAAVLGTQLFMHLEGDRDPMWLLYFKNFEANERYFIFFGAASFISILLIMVLGMKFHFGRGRLTIASIVLILIATIEMHHTGAKMWSYEAKAVPQRFKLDIAEMDKMSFGYPRTNFVNTVSFTPKFNVGVVETWYFARYVNFLNRTAGEEQARNILLGIQGGQRLFFSESIEHSSILSFLQDALRYKLNDQLISYNGDELKMDIEAPMNGYLSFIDNWDPSWKAYVDGQPVQIELLFGTFKSVRLTKGKHNVIFSYQPELFPAAAQDNMQKQS